MILICTDCGVDLPCSEEDRDLVNPEHGTYHRNRIYCWDCFNESFANCFYCDDVVVRDEIQVTDDGLSLCPSCYAHNVADIAPYDWVPDQFNFRGTGPHYGIELEIAHYEGEYNVDTSRVFERVSGFAYLKEDSSIGACGHPGFEIVTHPLGLDWIRENRVAEKMCAAKEYGFKSWETDTCGMHIHVGKNHFSQRTLFRALNFVNRHRPFILRMSQRTENEFDEWSALLSRRHVDFRELARTKSYCERTAISLEPDNTVEFRLFRGTLDESLFMKNVEFVDALLAFCKKARIKDCHPDEFIEYVQENSERWPSLFAFMRERFMRADTFLIA